MDKRRLAAIMFTDIVGYTRLMGADEEKALKVLENNRALHKDLLILYDGQKPKEIGDGMLCSFDSASKAVKCAIELIRKSNEYKDLKLRIGIHIGEVVFSGDDVFGDGVNIASRIEAMAIPDSVLISEKVYDEIRNKQNLKAKSIGTYSLKNDTKPRNLYAIANTRLKVPKSKDLQSIVVDDPDLQKSAISAIEKKKTEVKKRRFSLSSTRAGITVLFSLMAVAFGSLLFISFKNAKNIRWAKDELLPEVGRIADSVSSAAGIFGHHANTFKAFELADKAGKYIEGDQTLNDLLDRISNYKSITTEPDQANVYIKSYHDQNSKWKLLGTTPLDSIRLPLGMIRIKIEKEGFDTIEDLVRNVEWTEDSLSFTLPVAGSIPEGMVYCQSSWHEIKWEWLELPAYYMDKFEVTNKEYSEFVNVGGYQKQEYWKYPIISNGDTISWQAAMQLFRDQSNQPGPATWIAGDYPDGRDNHPVTGISWYEAAACASYMGKELPTLYHFEAAAMSDVASEILPMANFSNNDSHEAGGRKGSLHRFGLYDLAGNAREWGFNGFKSGFRLLLGGGWKDFDYVFTHDGNHSYPMDRSVSNGFRFIQSINDKPDARFFQEFDDSNKNKTQITLVSDAEFKAILNNYMYDDSPLNAKVEYTREKEEWTEQKITFDAAYGNERMSVYLFLPNNVKPPYQCIVHHPGTGAMQYNTSEGHINIDRLEFIVKTGRAAIFPVFKGMYERNDYYGSNTRPGPYQYRDALYMRGKDLRRSIDYLETRDDIDMNKIAYFGISWGGLSGAPMMAIEPRFKAGVLVLAGIWLNPNHLPETIGSSYLPRITIPVVMLNGKYDQTFPLETSQKPFFELLGTPPEHKKMILYNEGHSLPRNEMIKESLNWLDTYLGPVEPDL
jgi:class 3 adenylate cyclase/dienelactone hydrolase